MLEIAAPVLGRDRDHYGFRYQDAFDANGNRIFVFYGMGGFESDLNYRFRDDRRSSIIEILNADIVLPERIDAVVLGHLGRLNLAYHQRRDAAFGKFLNLCRNAFGHDLERALHLYESSYATHPELQRQAYLFRMFGIDSLLAETEKLP